MIVYVETSALVTLLIREAGSSDVDLLWDGADQILTSRISEVESRAALAAAHRAGRISGADHSTAKANLGRRLRQVQLVELTREVVRVAGDVAEQHALRAYDAVHLASAIAVRGPALVVATFDRELRRAAEAERLSLSATAG
ncbi:MAG: type II toxin-antitoxin system VapC family toxin [Actinomycetota bacterium]